VSSWCRAWRYRDLGAEHHVGSAEAEGPIKPFVGRAPGACAGDRVEPAHPFACQEPDSHRPLEQNGRLRWQALDVSATQNTTACARLNKASVCARHEPSTRLSSKQIEVEQPGQRLETTVANRRPGTPRQ
jgi:hypothetical protein